MLLPEMGKLRLREVTGQLGGGRAGIGMQQCLMAKPGASSVFLAGRGWVLPMRRPALGERRLDASTSPDTLRELRPEPASRRGDVIAHRCRSLCGFDGERGGEVWWDQSHDPHLPTSLVWLRRALPTNWEISKMLCDLHLRPSLSGPWLIVPEDIIFSSMKSTLGCSTCLALL